VVCAIWCVVVCLLVGSSLRMLECSMFVYDGLRLSIVVLVWMCGSSVCIVVEVCLCVVSSWLVDI